MTEDQFYDEYVPRVLLEFLNSDDLARREAELPVYVPIPGRLPLFARATDGELLKHQSQDHRDHLLVSLVHGNATYHGGHLQEVAGLVQASCSGRKVGISGGGARLRGSLEARKPGPATSNTSIRIRVPCWARPCSVSST